MILPPVAGFEAALGIEADYRSRVGDGLDLYAYPGPIALRGAALDALDRTLGELARHTAPQYGAVQLLAGVIRPADRLLVVWRAEATVALTTARWATADELQGWYLTLSCVAADCTERGLFTSMVRSLLTERQGSFIACTTASPQVGRVLRRASPTRTIFPDGHDAPPPRVVAVGQAALRSLYGSAAAASLTSGLVRRGWTGAEPGGGEGRMVLADLDGRLRGGTRRPGSDRPRTVGITGTNGKTSVAEFGRQLSERCGHGAASFGTLGVVSVIGRNPNPRIGRGPGAIPELARRLWDLGVDVLWFEAFSHALAEGLVDEVEVDIGVLTQIDLDHLGVHGSPAAYRAAKARLFEHVLVPGGIAVLDPAVAGADPVLAICRRRHLEVVRVGPGGDIDLRPVAGGGNRATLVVGNERFEVRLPTSAPYQRANLLAALGAAWADGAPPELLAGAMSGLRPAPGRLERLNVDVGYDIVVDAAHNGSGLEATLLHLRGETQGRLLALIASVGTADRNRWESIGEAASVLADLVVVGDESPYRRDPAEIRAGLISGCPDAAEVPDRAEAVQWLVDRAEPGDTVLLAGRADEDFRVISTGREPYPTDAELVARALAQQSRS